MGFFSELFNGLVSEKFLVKTTKKDQHCGNSVGRAKVCIE